jgi:uncharacterized protein
MSIKSKTLSRRNLTLSGIGSLATLALVGKSNKTVAAAPEHPNVAVVQRYYEAYGTGNIELIRNEIFAPNITWTIPGHHPLAGTKQGTDEVFAFFEQLNKANFKAEVLFLGGNDNYVVDVHRGWSNLTEGENVDQTWALLYEVADGRIKSAVNFPGDQHAADAFFWSVYQLKPLPERLVQ